MKSPVKCLVVDDDPDIADLLGELLGFMGADVSVVYSGQDAVDRAPQLQPRLVVLDINMPGMDGFETCEKLKLQIWSANAVFVAYTGMPNPRPQAKAVGFTHTVAKGDSPEVFEKILSDLSGVV